MFIICDSRNHLRPRRLFPPLSLLRTMVPASGSRIPTLLVSISRRGTDMCFPVFSANENPCNTKPILFLLFFLSFLGSFTAFLFLKKNTCISKKYFIVYKFMCNIYDISTHLILFKQFNILYNFISTKMCSERDNNFYEEKKYLTNKINIGDNQVMEKLGNSLNNKKSLLYSNYFL